MIIFIKRVYVGSGVVKDVGVNTRYIMKMELLDENHEHYNIASVLLVMEPNVKDGKPNLLYSRDPFNAIKSKITKAQKVRDD